MSRILVLLTGWLAAAALASVPLYNGAGLVQEKQAGPGEQRVITGKNQKVQGHWQFASELRLDAFMQQRIYQLDTVDSLAQVAAFYRQWIADAGLDVLYYCAGRDCGSSNVWANNLFAERRLYGPDSNQFYWALRRQDDFFMLYLVERGNGQLFVNISQVTANAAMRESLYLDQACDHPQLAAFVSGMADELPLLLLASVAGDEAQGKSLALAARCAASLRQRFAGRPVNALGLGGYDRYWQPVSATRLELLPQPSR